MHELPPLEPNPEQILARPWIFVTALSLWTTLLAAGPLLVASVAALAGFARPPALFGRVAPSLSLFFGALPLLLWIVGAHHAGWGVLHKRRVFLLLGVFLADAFLWLLWGVLRPQQLRSDLAWSGLSVVSMLLAGYPAMSGAEDKPRRLWPRLFLFPHLVAHAFLAGSALLVLALAYFGGTRSVANVLLRCVLGGVCAHGILVLAGIALARRRPEGAQAVSEMISGPMAARFWIIAVLMGTALPIYILAFHFARPAASGLWGAVAATLALLGLLVYEDCCAGAARRAPSGSAPAG